MWYDIDRLVYTLRKRAGKWLQNLTGAPLSPKKIDFRPFTKITTYGYVVNRRNKNLYVMHKRILQLRR